MSNLGLVPVPTTEQKQEPQQTLKEFSFREAAKTVDEGAALRKQVGELAAEGGKALLKALDFAVGLGVRSIKGTIAGAQALKNATVAGYTDLKNKFDTAMENRREKQENLITSMQSELNKQATMAIHASQLPTDRKLALSQDLLGLMSSAVQSLEEADKLSGKEKLAAYKAAQSTLEEKISGLLSGLIKEQKDISAAKAPELEKQFAGLKSAQVEQIRAADLDRKTRSAEISEFNAAMKKGLAELETKHAKPVVQISSEELLDTSPSVSLRRGISSLLSQSAKLSSAHALTEAKVELVTKLDAESDQRMAEVIAQRRQAKDEAFAAAAAKKQQIFAARQSGVATDAPGLTAGPDDAVTTA